jgi:protein-S-isoprenylcysteine O-methyltransferase Ste14
MTRSASTPRLQATLALYLLLVGAAAVAGSPALPPLVDQVVRFVAALLVGIACLGRIWCSAFIAGHKDARLVTSGPYAACRNPLYVLSLVGALGLGLATRTATLTVAVAALLALLFSSAVRAEEQVLAALHGTDFERYAATTPRWWPAFSGYAVPDAVDLRPRVFWKSFLDAGSFVVLYLLVDTARVLRQSGLLPTLLHLP